MAIMIAAIKMDFPRDCGECPFNYDQMECILGAGDIWGTKEPKLSTCPLKLVEDFELCKLFDKVLSKTTDKMQED